jgi:prenyltransferase beta subunit
MWAILALVTAGEKVDEVSIQWLKSKQDVSGGYAIDPNTTLSADTNSTSLAIQALVAAGVKPSDPSVKKAIEFLKTQQNKDGGFPFVTPSSFGTDSDTTSTAWVLQALVATGQDIESKTWIKAAITPMGFLMSMQNASGGFAYQKAVPDDSLLSTAQAIPALMGKPFPIKLTAPPSTTEKLPKEEPIFSTGALIWIALMIMGLFGALGLAYFVFFKLKKD